MHAHARAAQALAYLVAVLAALDARDVQLQQPLQHVTPVGHALQAATRAWLQELKDKIDSMQRKRLLPFNASPLSRRLACVLETQN
jgi:hypothetical protein